MSVIIVLYEFGVLPFLLGLLWCRKKEQMGFCSLYVHGYVTMLSVFFIPAVILIRMRWLLSDLCKVWGIFSLFVPILCFLFIVTKEWIYADEFRYLAGNLKYAFSHLRGMLCVCLGVILFSIAWVMPDQSDHVPEIVGVSLKTNSMYVYQPYNMLPYADNSEKAWSPIDMLYATVSSLSKMNATVMIHMYAAFFLLVLYAAIGWFLADCFFKNQVQKKSIFTMLWAIFATVSVWSRRALAFGILQNIWNGETFLVACILPLVFAATLVVGNSIKEKDKMIWIDAAFLIESILCAQLMYVKGAFLAIFVIFGVFAAIWIQKGLNYGRGVRKCKADMGKL
ncbi:MAG: DUF6077 domain-containing protein [Agathobacter sp.]